MIRNSYKFLFVILSLSLLAACGGPDKAEQKIPSLEETCGGSAVQSRYLVFYYDGSWEVVENADREDFKQNHVVPRLEDIDFIEYDQVISPRNDQPMVHANASFDNWGPRDIQAAIAWQQGHRGYGVTVAVIDSGVDVSHPQLMNRIAYNEGEIGTDGSGRDKRFNGVDDDGNGFIDDYAGYDFITKSGHVTDEEGHGTHVAGIIAGEHFASDYRSDVLQGVAPEAKILPLKFLGPQGGYLSDAMRAMDYAVAAGAKIINASWGGPSCSRSLMEKMSEVGRSQVLLAVAAGNSSNNLDRYPEYPAAFSLPTQITVGSVGISGWMAEHSNYSERLVHLFAPGLQVKSAYPGGRYATFSGTSMATPFVAGAAAVLLSANPDLSIQEVKNLLLSTTASAPSSTSDYRNISKGRLNLANALRSL